MRTPAPAITREHVEAFLAWMSDSVERGGESTSRYRPASVRNRYTAIKQFFAWASDEGEIVESPMRKVRPPIIPGPMPRNIASLPMLG